MTSSFAFDVCVVGATPAGIAAAVRVARAGYRVLLTQHTGHLGGMCTNGLGQWDAKSNHRRCPIFGEILDRLETHYRETFGEGSAHHRAAQYRVDQYPVGSYEPKIIEGIFNDLVAAESTITTWLQVYSQTATVAAGKITAVTFRDRPGEGVRTVTAHTFIDASYEGDLAAAAGAPYRVGREAASEYDEPHAGQIWTQVRSGHAPSLATRGVLNLHTFHMQQGAIDPTSPRSGDRFIQAYNTRPCVSRDPATRLYLDQPPANYDRAEYLRYTRRSLAISADINGKNSYNSAILPGENWDYPEGDWDTRDRITQRHLDFCLGLMWFLHNDPSLSEAQRQQFRTWGLANDEYTDHQHVPYEMYVRETRRIVGRHVLSENDLLPRPGLLRPRPFADSIAFTDWYMDSHSCSPDIGTFGPGPGMVGNAAHPYDGKLILTEEFRPGMVPYRSLLPQGIDNLLVPVCASSTHIAWGSLRLEPIWIQLGEVAGYAACQALKTGTTVAALAVAPLQRTLLADGVGIAFFNQHRTAHERADYADRQLAACHGEWDSFDLA
jgi:hypothetical protein